MPQYKYSRDDYYRLTNAPCLDVAKALGMEINERESDRKSWKIKGEQGLAFTARETAGTAFLTCGTDFLSTS